MAETFPACMAELVRLHQARWTAAGVAVLAYDQRGFGRTALDKAHRSPGGAYGRTDAASQREDLHSMLGEARRRWSEVIRPPSKAAVIFLRPMAGKPNASIVSSGMAGVARHDRVDRMASTPNP